MLEKKPEKRIDLNNIPFNKWFIENHKKVYSQQHCNAESSTKIEYSPEKNGSLSEVKRPQTKKLSIKPKLSCFRKNSEKDLGIDDINEEQLAIKNYDFQPRFLESSLLFSSAQNIPLISNNFTHSGFNSPTSNSPEFENTDLIKPFENSQNQHFVDDKKAKFGMECSIFADLGPSPLLDLEKIKSYLYLGVKSNLKKK